MEKNVFQYFRGNEEHGNKLIKVLEELGGKNSFGHGGKDSDCYYYIDIEGTIVCLDVCEGPNLDWLLNNYKEIILTDLEEYDFQPFDKILVRDDENTSWSVDLFTSYAKNRPELENDYKLNFPIIGLRADWKIAIPYNEDTKHLLNTI